MLRETILAERVEEAYEVSFPERESIIVTDDPRAAVVEKMRELAGMLERHELSGASVQWNDSPDQPYLVYVECYKPDGPGVGFVRMTRAKFEPATRLHVVSEE